MPFRFSADGIAAEHTGQLTDTILVGDRPHRRRGVPALGCLAHDEVPVGVRGELREMGDTQHLASAGEGSELLANRKGGRAADARINLVEHEHRGVVGVGEREPECECHPTALTARRRLGKRQRR